MIKIVKQKTNVKEGDLLNIVVNHKDLWNPISTGLSRTSDIDNLLDNIQSILTSNQDLDIYGCTFHAEVVNMPRGASNALRILNIAEDSRTKRSIIQIKNKDNLCCPRAVIVGLTYHTNIILGKEYDHDDIRYIRMGRNLQTTLAQELCNQLGEYNRNYFTLDDIANIEKILNIQIKVVAAECFNQVIYSGEEKDVKVYLYKNGNHFDTIKSMTGFYGESYYCEKCDKPYQNKDGHKCKKGVKMCLMCFKPKHEENSAKRIYCEKCNRYCFNQECLANHSEVCERFYKCLKCNKILKRGDKMVDEGKKMIEEGNNKKGNQIIKKGNKMIEEGSKEHRCGWEKCRNCYKEVEILKHRCYMQRRRQKGGICETTIKDDDKIYKVKGCKNCDRKGCTVTFPDKTNKRLINPSQLKTLLLRDIEIGHQYTVTNWEQFTSKDNKEKNVITLIGKDECKFKLFLPDRFAKTADKIIEDMVEYDLLMTYNGLKEIKNEKGFLKYKIHDIKFKRVESCKNCDIPDKTNKRIKYHIYQCKDCKNRNKKPLNDTKPFKCVKCGSKKHTTKCSYTEKYLFFDYEAMQETGKHIANLVISHDFSGNVNSFKTNEDFCKWLISRDHKGYTAIAHYSKGYDSYFILKYCVENGIKPFCIYNGSKIMLMEIKSINLRIIDSSNFVQGPLKNFPKTFGLKELKKGYFPHFFNTTENQNYIGKIPDTKYYGVNSMKPKEREEFLEWHKQKRKENYVFDFKKELYEYCNSDVDILRNGCLELRKQFLEIANIDPFRYITIAGTCMAVYRSKFIKTNTIAVVDKPNNDKYSQQSISWLNSLNNPDIKHALNNGEVKICGLKVDGFDEKTNTVYQYHGCFWHGCIKCYSSDFINNKNKTVMEDLYEKTIERSEQIRNAGYNLIEMWECNWTKYKEYKEEMKKIEKDVKQLEKLEPRNAFFGGRTNATKLRVKGKKLKYIDVCSLYPTVQYFDYYPVGHPNKILKPLTYDPKWYGLIKCDILPPKQLYHPVLPVKIKNKSGAEKLTFPLCQLCAKLNNQDLCNHTDFERMISGTWCSNEVKKAIEKGYKIINIDEVWNFEKKSNYLFKEYVKAFMKIKLETSPWQDDFETEDEYRKAVKEKLGIELGEIENNPGKRAVAKSCLVNLWGKFGQRQNMGSTEYVTDVKRFYEILLDDRLDKIQINDINDTMLQISYKYKDYYVENDFNTNIFIAAFTTANARLRLYETLDKLGEVVVYYDTDSVVYIDDGKNTIKTGCLLGEWTDELGKDVWIVDWLSTGPKSYCYKTNTDKVVCKIKGFTLNYETSKKIDSNSINNILEKKGSKISTQYNRITRDTKTKELLNKIETKEFGFVYDKRVVLENFDTIPFGY
jgi:hypothetical protein